MSTTDVEANVMTDQGQLVDPARIAQICRHHEVVTFLNREAELLDRNLLQEWLEECVGESVDYFMPVRTAGDEYDVDDVLGHLNETRDSLVHRVGTMLAPSSYANRPPSRTRRLVSNVRVEEAGPGRLAVSSYVAFFRNRYNETDFDVLTAERRDVLVETEGGLRIVERLVVVDQSTLGTDNLAIFL